MIPTRAESPRILSLTVGILTGCATGPRPRPALAPASGPAAAPLAPSGGPLAATKPTARSRPLVGQVTLAAVGDVLMHGAVKQSAAVHGAGAGRRRLLLALRRRRRPALPAGPDLREPRDAHRPPVVAGLAGVRLQRPARRSSPPCSTLAVHLVSVANNHAFDQGRPGFEETLRSLDAAGMTYLGAGPAPHAAGPVRVERGGLQLAFLGYTYGLNQDGNACPPARAGRPGLPPGRGDRSRRDRRGRPGGGRPAPTRWWSRLHWGVEYEQQPRAQDVELAHRLADAGALVILGHHPHVLQPVELYRRADGRIAVIAYSLGNFVSNQSRNFVPGVTPDAVAATRDGVLLRVALARRDYGRGVVRVEVVGADFLPLWTENDTAEIDPRKEPGRRPAIRVVADDRALAAVRAELERMPDPLPPDQVDRWVRLRQQEALLVSRRTAVANLARRGPAAGAQAGGAGAVGEASTPSP